MVHITAHVRRLKIHPARKIKPNGKQASKCALLSRREFAQIAERGVSTPQTANISTPNHSRTDALYRNAWGFV